MPPGRYAPAYDPLLYDAEGNLIDPNAVPPPPEAVPSPTSTDYSSGQPVQVYDPSGGYVPPPEVAPPPADAGPPPQPAYLPESSASYQYEAVPPPPVSAGYTPGSAPPPQRPTTAMQQAYQGLQGAGLLPSDQPYASMVPIGGAPVSPPTSTDYSSGRPVEVYDPSGAYVDRSDEGRVAAARDAANQRQRQRGIEQVQALERAMMLGPESRVGVTTEDILAWRPPGNTLDAGAPRSTDAGFLWGPPLWSNSPSVARTTPRRSYVEPVRGEVPPPEPLITLPPRGGPRPVEAGAPAAEPAPTLPRGGRRPVEGGPLAETPPLVDRFGNPFRTAETVVPPPEPSAGQPYIRQTRGDPRFGPGEVIPPPGPTGRFGRPIEGFKAARPSPPIPGKNTIPEPEVAPRPIFERRPTAAEAEIARRAGNLARDPIAGFGLVYRTGRGLARASLTPPGQAAVRVGGAIGGLTRKLITPKTVIGGAIGGGLVTAGLAIEAARKRGFATGGGPTSQPTPVPTPDENAPNDLRAGEAESPRESGMVYITDAAGAFVGVRDADGTPLYFPEGATDADKDAIVADVQSRLTAPAVVEPPAGGNVPVQPIAPLATGTAAAGQAGGAPTSGTPLLTPDGTDTGLTLTSDGSVNTDRGSSGGDGYRGGGSSRGGYRSGGSPYRGSRRRKKKGEQSRGSFGSSPEGSGFPFNRPPSPIREHILAAIAESLANSRNTR